MWKLYTIILAIFVFLGAERSSNVLAPTPRISEKGVISNPVTITTEDIDLYVETTGSDDNSCLTAGNPCLTAQEAVNRIPKQIKHDVTLTIGAGNFAGVMITGFHVEYGGTLTIEGTIGDYSPATGKQTGTATGGTTTQCVDAAGGWTGNNLRGALALVNGEYRVIRDNDGTTFNLVGALSATCNGKVYEIEEQDTVLNSAGTENWIGRLEVITNVAMRDNFTINDIKASGGTASFLVFGGSIPTVNRIRGTGGTYGGLLQGASGEARFYDTCFDTTASATLALLSVAPRIHTIDRMLHFGGAGNGCWITGTDIASADNIYADDMTGSYAMVIDGINLFDSTGIYIDNATSVGLLVQSSNHIKIDDIVVDTCGGDCVQIFDTNKMNFGSVDVSNATNDGIEIGVGVSFLDIDSGTIDTNGGYGLKVDDNASGNKTALSFANLSGTITVATNTLGGVIGMNNSVIALTDVDGSNTGYGLTLDSGSTATITSATGLTGTTDDATINGGTTDLTWGTHFATDGDIAINHDNGCRIERKD
jgi:hypothetical protein